MPMRVVGQNDVFISTSRLEYTFARRRPKSHPFYTKRYIYKVSLSSLFILDILAATDRSMVRSAISTMRPPLISGLTLGTTLSFWPVET
jgi:hypothetical protein